MQKNKNPLWDILGDIKIHKMGNLLDNEDYEKAFDAFMVTRCLAMDDNLCDYVGMIQEYHEVLTKKEYYKLLVDFIPKTTKFTPFTKSNPSRILESDIEVISRYNKCSAREARSYIEMCGTEYVSMIKSKYGGKIK